MKLRKLERAQEREYEQADRVIANRDSALKNMLVKPCHIVQIRDQVNDIHLPKLNISSKESSLRFDWKALFSLFFAEGKQYLFACRDWVASPTAIYVNSFAHTHLDGPPPMGSTIRRLSEM